MDSRPPTFDLDGMTAANGFMWLFLMAIVLLALAFYLLVKAINLVVRVLMRYPRTMVLWVLLILCVGTWGVAAYAVTSAPTSELPQIAIGAAGILTVTLLVTARTVEVAHDDLFQPERPRGTLILNVLKRPWWETP